MSGFKSFLSQLGKDAKTVFAFLASSKGQTEIATIEGATEAVVSSVNAPAGLALTGIANLANAALKQVVTAEVTATAADQQSGTGAQKASAVATALAPQVQTILQSLGVKAPTAAQVENISTVVAGKMADIVNAFPPSTT